MINPLFANLFGSMVENRISKCAEVKENRAKGEVGFRSKHSTVDHGITLRHIIEKVWGVNKKYYVVLFTSRAVESKKHFILECDVFKGIRDSYHSMLASIPWGTVRRLGQMIINLSKKKIELQKEKNKEADSVIYYF